MKYLMFLKDALLEGYNNSTVSTSKIIVALLVAYVTAVYIHFVYKYVTNGSFYNKNYGMSLIIISVITAGILLAMQASLVISLGMVGALSIVRFRTAIKDTLDLLFLFWSISVGIICGAGIYDLAIIMSLVATAGIIIFQWFPIKKSMCLLVINAKSKKAYNDIETVCEKCCKSYSVRTKNMTKDGMELVIEVCLKSGGEDIVDDIMNIDEIEYVNLLANDI